MPYTAKFKHPVPKEGITEENFGEIANDLYYLQSVEMIELMTQMIEVQHWGDDDTDYHTSMRDAHQILQNIAYDGSCSQLIHFLHEKEDDFDGFPTVTSIDSAGGLCEALNSYSKLGDD